MPFFFSLLSNDCCHYSLACATCSFFSFSLFFFFVCVCVWHLSLQHFAVVSRELADYIVPIIVFLLVSLLC